MTFVPFSLDPRDSTARTVLNALGQPVARFEDAREAEELVIFVERQTPPIRSLTSVREEYEEVMRGGRRKLPC